ncbi:MAG: RnfH family protein [Methylocystaceae bacterium]|nr:RnfH family protein [Methylocystaceae bacterium]
MNVGIVYGTAIKQIWLKMDVPDGSTIEEAIKLSGILDQFPEIDLETQSVGVFGRISKLDKVLENGERVEIYRPITADPELVERRDVQAND